MAKKRAFVRYTKSGEIVPGSLILTNGSYPDKPALWKEITTDKCCDEEPSGGCEYKNITVSDVVALNSDQFSTVFESIFFGYQITIGCNRNLPQFGGSTNLITYSFLDEENPFSFTTWADVINYLNSNEAFTSVFSNISFVGGEFNNIQLSLTTEHTSCCGCAGDECLEPEIQIVFLGG